MARGLANEFILTHVDVFILLGAVNPSVMRSLVPLSKSSRTNFLKCSAKSRLVPLLCSFSLSLGLSATVFAQGVTVRFAGDSDVGEGGRWTRAAAEEWAKKTGNKVEYISRPNDASATLQQFQQVPGRPRVPISMSIW